MTKHTSLPYFDADEKSEDWYVLTCDLCPWETEAGLFHDAEMGAADHLEEDHPEERREAYAAIFARAERFRLEGPNFKE